MFGLVGSLNVVGRLSCGLGGCVNAGVDEFDGR